MQTNETVPQIENNGTRNTSKCIISKYMYIHKC